MKEKRNVFPSKPPTHPRFPAPLLIPVSHPPRSLHCGSLSLPHPVLLSLHVVWPRPAPHLSGTMEVQNQPGVPLIRELVSNLEAVLLPSCLSLNLHPPRSLLWLPSRSVLEQILPCLHLARAPLTLRGGPVPPPLEVFPGKTMPRLYLVEPAGPPLRSPRHHAVWVLFAWYPVLLRRDMTSAHRWASVHFFSEISRLMFVRNHNECQERATPGEQCWERVTLVTSDTGNGRSWARDARRVTPGKE
jgi:hypothetical protein